MGNVVIGISSWGLHANGYSLARRILESKEISYEAVVEGVNLAEELTKSIAIYSNLVLKLQEKELIKAVAHITGAAFLKLKRIVPHNIDLILEMPEPPKIFNVMKLGNVPLYEMYRVFNMGVGMVLIVNENNLNMVRKTIERCVIHSMN